MHRRKNRIKALRLNRLRLNQQSHGGHGQNSGSGSGDSDAVVSSTTDAEPRKVKPLIIKRTWTKIEPPMAGSPPTLVLRSIPGGHQGTRKYNVEVAKLLLRLNTSATTKDGDEPTDRAVTSSSRDYSSKDEESGQSQAEDMSSDMDVDENYLASATSADDEMTENEGVDEKVQNSPPRPTVAGVQFGICEVCQSPLNGGNGSPNKVPVIAPGSVQLFKCRGCGGDFSRRGNLVIHLRIHNEKRLYDCSFDGCAESFRCLAEVRSHERSHQSHPYSPQGQGQRSPGRGEHPLMVSPAQGNPGGPGPGPGERIALRIFKAGSPRSNRWNSMCTDLKPKVGASGSSSSSPNPGEPQLQPSSNLYSNGQGQGQGHSDQNQNQNLNNNQ